MHIIKATDPIAVEHPVFCWFGQPGIGKSSLGYSTTDPLLLDFDSGAHRASHRRDTLLIATWADVADLMASSTALDPYRTIVVDTVGRCLDLLTAHINEQSPKYARDGNLTQQGWGVLKVRFRTWMTQLRTLGKDVVLIAHQKEDKDGDTTIVRPDITGGSFGEVMKTADFVGFVYMRGKDRVIDFNPTDRWLGKNPAGWKPLLVPPVEKASAFMADLFVQGRAALGDDPLKFPAVLRSRAGLEDRGRLARHDQGRVRPDPRGGTREGVRLDFRNAGRLPREWRVPLQWVQLRRRDAPGAAPAHRSPRGVRSESRESLRPARRRRESRSPPRRAPLGVQNDAVLVQLREVRGVVSVALHGRPLRGDADHVPRLQFGRPRQHGGDAARNRPLRPLSVRGPPCGLL